MIYITNKKFLQPIFFVTFLSMSFILFGSISAAAWDNCPFGEINEPYPGTCGRYIDTDNDYICDLSQPSPEDRINIVEDGTDNLQEVDAGSTIAETDTNGRLNYYFLPIAAILFILYLTTLMLSKKEIIKKGNHKKIWNILLLITFLVSGIFGIILAISISYGIRLDFYADLLFWHVEFGISMAMISIFHIAWHWKYYKRIIMKST